MKRSIFLIIIFAFLTIGFTTQSFAKNPMVEFFFVKFDGENGLKRAEVAIIKTGFKLVKGTYQGEDRVGVLGEYTAAVGLSTEYPTAVVFIVAGPDYQKCHKYGREIQTNFNNAK